MSRPSLRDKIAREAGCEHPPEPDEPIGYCQWFDWVERKAETHDQIQCPKCGLWVIWTPKESRKRRLSAAGDPSTPDEVSNAS